MDFLKNIYYQFVFLLRRVGAPKRLPVLLYHAVGPVKSRLSVSEEEFEKQLSWLKENGYQSILPKELAETLQSKKISGRRVLISFDDGFKDNYEVALPLLDKYGFKAAFFIAAGFVGKKANYCRDEIDQTRELMSAEQIRELKTEGHFVGNHFYSHQNLSELSAEKIAGEFEAGKSFLLDLLSDSEAANFVAYPRNRISDIVLTVMKEKGVKLAFAGSPGLVNKDSAPLALPRVEVVPDKSLAGFVAGLSPLHYWIRSIFDFFRKRFGLRGFYFFSFLLLLRMVFLLFSLAGFPAGAGLIDSWWTTYGGDELGYYNSAKALLQGDFLAKAHPLGYPLFLLPFLKIFNLHNFLSLSSFNVFFGGVIMYVLASALIYLAAFKIFRSRLIAYLSSLLFCVYPYFFFFIFKIFSAGGTVMDQFIASRFVQLMFYYVASDPLSLVLMTISLLLFVDIFESKKERGIFYLGVVSAWAAITRIQNSAILPLYFFFFILKKRYATAAKFIIGSLPLIIFQVAANIIGRHSFWVGIYGLKKVNDPSTSMIGLLYPFRVIKYPLDHGPLLLAVLAVLIFFVCWGGWSAIRKNKPVGLIVVAYLLANSLPLLFLEPTMRNPRYFLPVIPIIFIFLLVGFKNLIIFIPTIWTKKT